MSRETLQPFRIAAAGGGFLGERPPPPPPPPPQPQRSTKGEGIFPKPEPHLLDCFKPIFYCTKFLGMYPHRLEANIHGDPAALCGSRTGSLIVIVMMILLTVVYNVMMLMFSNWELLLSQATLSLIINTVLSYFGLLAMQVDLVNAIRKRENLRNIFKQLQAIDDRLGELQVREFGNREVRRRIIAMIVCTVLCESVIVVSTYFLFWHHEDGLVTLLWMFSCFPTLYSTFDKIWFLGLAGTLRRRFAAVNAALMQLVEQHEDLKRLRDQRLQGDSLKTFKGELSYRSQGQQHLLAEAANADFSSSAFGKSFFKSPCRMQISSELGHFESAESKLMSLCQLHSDICDTANLVTTHWTQPILCQMAYGFVLTIAHLYFLYLARWDESIPSLFTSARNLAITVVALTYLVGKCVAVMLCSWKTSQEAKFSGICFHRCAIAANTTEIYELVNHLSVKVLNHTVNLSAGGFFTLDMNNLYGILGGLTSYLIIFIQFDLEARQSRQGRAAAAAANTTTTTTTTAAAIAAAVVGRVDA